MRRQLRKPGPYWIATLFCLTIPSLWQSGLQAQTGASMASTTVATYRKSNQSKVFYHDGSWWALGFHQPKAVWYLWKYNGSS